MDDLIRFAKKLKRWSLIILTYIPFGNKTLFFIFFTCFFVIYFSWIFLSLPRVFQMSDYKPPLLTEVYDRNGHKIGEFFKERRLLFKYENMPTQLINAFVAAEDGSFFSHRGINLKAILRAALANLKAGKKVQGGSTITQQLARTLLLTSKKTYTRKIKEVILSLRIETTLSKQDILYMYLNQIYLGHGAYGVEMASRIYFRKSTKNLSLGEMALLAGLPKAPSRFSPIFNPERAKARQVYVLNRMKDEMYITEDIFQKTLKAGIKIYTRKDFNEQSPYYLETVRRALLPHFEPSYLLEKGLKIWTAMDFSHQIEAQKSLKKGLEELDKRQGFRGVIENLPLKEKQLELMEASSKKLKSHLKDHLILPPYKGSMGKKEEEVEQIKETLAEEKIKEEKEQTDFPWEEHKPLLTGVIFKALITSLEEDKAEVQTPWGKEILHLKDLTWAIPIKNKKEQQILDNLKDVFKVQDVISVRLRDLENENENENESESEISPFVLELYQEPLVEGGLISFDLKNSDVIALVGGYDFNRSQFNRAYQAQRQSGSIFKSFVYGAALEKGFHAASLISDAPVVFTPEEAEEKEGEPADSFLEEEEEEKKDIWKPSNINERFSGDLLFRTALIRSLNVPTVKIIEKIGLKWVQFYAKQLGILSPLNPDYTMALGSSSLTLYEITKAFSLFPRLGRDMSPQLVHKVEDREGNPLLLNLSMQELFQKQTDKKNQFIQENKDKWFSEENTSEKALQWKQFLEEDSKQLLSPESSYVMTHLLSSVIHDPEGTGRRAQVLKRPVGGKTGTTDGYYDTWFVGFSPFISTGVWVGFDTEKTLGHGETGSRVALPIWIDYMEASHSELPIEDFTIPEKIVFVNIDTETGGLVSSDSTKIARQAFIEGTEPESIKSEEENQSSTEEEEEESLEPAPSSEENEEEEENFIREGL